MSGKKNFDIDTLDEENAVYQEIAVDTCRTSEMTAHERESHDQLNFSEMKLVTPEHESPPKNKKSKSTFPH